MKEETGWGFIADEFIGVQKIFLQSLSDRASQNQLKKFWLVYV